MTQSVSAAHFSKSGNHSRPAELNALDAQLPVSYSSIALCAFGKQAPSSRLTCGLGCMTLVIAKRMADGQITLVAVAAFAQGLDVFQRCINHVHMLPANPARHLAM